eukprot:gene2945-13696_t
MDDMEKQDLEFRQTFLTNIHKVGIQQHNSFCALQAREEEFSKMRTMLHGEKQHIETHSTEKSIDFSVSHDTTAISAADLSGLEILETPIRGEESIRKANSPGVSPAAPEAHSLILSSPERLDISTY